MTQKGGLKLAILNIDYNNLINKKFRNLKRRLEDNINNEINLKWK
jgi:hypothetical protein